MDAASFQRESFLKEPVDDNAYSSINPTPETVYESELRSNAKLGGAIIRMIGREGYFPQWEAEANDAMEAAKINYGKDIDYLYLLAHQSQDESRPIGERQAWADAFTEQSIKIYGAPDPNIIKMIEDGGVERILEEYKGEVDAVRDWLISTYGDVLSALNLDDRTEELSPEEIITSFESGLEELKHKDPRWQDWQVVSYEGAILSCESSDKQIKVGNKRAPVAPKKLKGLFAHEVLRHGQTAVNASEIGIASALPYYINAEEGFAKIFEFALGEDPSTISADRYMDIAYTLGMLDGEKHTRRELVERILDGKRAKGEELTSKDTESAYKTANRVFRGTPGSDEVSGVFTKDISYFAGFVPNLEFIRQQLQSGQTIGQVMSLINTAKFDPNDPTQLNYVKSKIAQSHAPILPLALELPPAGNSSANPKK
jgi:hypothetical protein